LNKTIWVCPCSVAWIAHKIAARQILDLRGLLLQTSCCRGSNPRRGAFFEIACSSLNTHSLSFMCPLHSSGNPRRGAFFEIACSSLNTHSLSFMCPLHSSGNPRRGITGGCTERFPSASEVTSQAAFFEIACSSLNTLPFPV
jgi:hypothetical protein